MKNAKTLLIIVVIIIVILLYVKFKTPVLTQSSTSNVNPSNAIAVGTPLYATYDGLNVYTDNTLQTLYKTAALGEWVGNYQSTELIGGEPFYKLSGGRYVAGGSSKPLNT